MTFSRGTLADRAGGFTQCNVCGIAASITAGDERNGRTLGQVEAEHLGVCPGTSAARATKDKEKTSSGSVLDTMHDITDVDDLEKFIESQINDKANELADFIIVENFHSLRRSLADHFSSNTGKVLTWRFMGDRGRALIGRRRRAADRERAKEIYLAGATDALAALAQELFWKIEDYKR